MTPTTKIKFTTRAGILLTALTFCLLTGANAQVAYKQLATSTMELTGTSTLHNWEMTSKDVTCLVNFSLNPDGTPIELSGLKMTLPAESLKSGKGAMDKNAYNSLKTDQFKTITFTSASAKFTGDKVKVSGSLTIAGTTKTTDVDATCKVMPDKSLQCKGSKSFKMSEYKVDPPSFAFGTVKTGDDVTILFEMNLSPVKP